MTVRSEGWIAFWLVLWATVFGLTIVYAVDNAEGAWTANTYNSSTDLSAVYGRDKFVHTKDDQYAVAYVSSADELWIAHKPTTGGSWEYGEIATSYDTYQVVGVLCSSNNTLIVCAIRDEGTPLVARAYVKWPGDDWDTWNAYLVKSVSGLVLEDCAINNTDDICLTMRWGSNLYASIFNLTTKTVTSTSTTFHASATAYGVCAANQSGDFFILYGNFAGNLYMRDYNKTLGAVTITGYWYYPDLVCLPNDRFGATAYYVFGGATRNVYWMYQNTHNGAWTKVIIETQAATDTWTYPKCLISQDSTTVWAIGFNSVDTIVYDWHAAWNAAEATWQASENVAAGATTAWPLGGSNSVWPKTAGISWCQPKTGQATNFRTEAGAADSMQIWTQGDTWTPDLTTDWPSITTVSLPEGTYGTHYSYTLSRSGGTAPFTWSILSGPAWLNIGASNGTIYGDPTGVGTTSVEIKLEDAIPRSDQDTFSLKINPATTPTSSRVVTISADDLHLAELWFILVVAATAVGVIREFKKIGFRR